MRDDVDTRLLLFAPFYKEKLLHDRPELEGQLTDEIVEGILLEALVANGQAKVAQRSDGSVWLEATDDYLRYIETNH
jgi:hypothetical protein